MLPFGELERCQDFLFRTMGRNDRVFVRPDSPLKLFTGQIVTRDTFAADLEFMSFYEFPRKSLVVVSSPKSIEAEWRFVVANHRVVTGCQYKLQEKMDFRSEVDPAAFEFASTIAAAPYQPDPVWILDVCRTADKAYRLLEIGGFSFADLYACSKAAIVDAVSEAALAEWRKGQK